MKREFIRIQNNLRNTWQHPTEFVLRNVICIGCIASLFMGSTAFSQNLSKKNIPQNTSLGKIGKGKRDVQKKTCLVPVKIRGMSAGDLAEVIDAAQNRVAIVRLERLDRPPGRLAAQVIVGEEKCSSLSGYTIRPLSSFPAAGSTAPTPATDSIATVAAHFLVHQFALPGLALNKFLSPGYTQRGFAFRGSGTFPRQPIRLGKFALQGAVGALFSSSATTPALDLVKDGKVIGTQKFATTALHLRAGARALTSDSRLWTEAGVVLLDKLSSKSTLAKSSADVDALFPVIRELNGQGFGLYVEQGLVVGDNNRLSFSGALGLGTKFKTPVLEDGDSTNTTENFTTEGLPLSAGINFSFPIWRGAFAETNFDYVNVKLALPLINEQQSKSQIEKLSFSVGVGYRF